MKPSMNFGGGAAMAPGLPDWKQQRNAWQDQMQGGNMGDPGFRQQMFAARDQWQQARDMGQQPNSPMGQPTHTMPDGSQMPGATHGAMPISSGPIPRAMPTGPMPGGSGGNWFQQNRPALEAFFAQLGMKPQGLMPFAPTTNPFGPKVTPGA